MAPLHSVSPAATPYQHGQSTTAQPDSRFAVPATPTRFTEHRSGNDVVSGGPQLAVTSDSRKCHGTSGTTPPLLRTHPTSKVSESKQSLDQQFYQELMKHLVEVDTEAFVRAVLYKDAPKMMEEDEGLAAEYLELPETPSPHEGRAEGDPTDSSPQQPSNPPPTTSHSTESTPNSRPSTPRVPTHRKPLPRDRYNCESDMYADYVELLNSVSRFFQANKKDVDEAWLPARPPRCDNIPTARKNADPPLSRVFQDTHNLPRSFSRYKYGQAGLKPDLCFLIKPKESKPKRRKSKPRPVPAHWKDVLVPIELKKTGNMSAVDLVQMTQYARSIMVEQYDRMFVISVLVTGHMCRVFHWDVAGAQVTQAFNIHENPQLFLQVMGRLTTMTPSELGYDIHFSNAGRVRSNEEIKTHLTIHVSEPRPFINAIPSPTPECTHKLVVKLKEMLFESTSGLFSRATRVWRAVAVNDPPSGARRMWRKKSTYIVKQNWADDRRPNEGIFHTLAKDVAAVPQLVGMEEREFTHLFRARFKEEELGVPHVVTVEHARESADTNISGGDESGAPDSASSGAEVSDEDSSSEDTSEDDESSDDESSDDESGDDESGGGSDAASDDDGSASEHLSAADVSDEEDVGDDVGDEEEDLRDGEDVRDKEVRAEEDVVEEVRAEQEVVDQEVADAGNKVPFERVLLRFVFKGRGRPLSEATDSLELLEAAAQWVPALVELDRLGITHRDVSYGNLLLPRLKDKKKKRQASIIDLGHSHLKDPTKIVALYPEDNLDQEIWANRRPHHHVTGTLPFVAIELLQKADRESECKHALHHDLESVFWVLLYTCIRHHEGKRTYLSRILDGITSSKPHIVHNEKKCFLTAYDPLHEMGGKFQDLERFLLNFGKLCMREGEMMEASEVQQLISNEIVELRKERKERAPKGTKRRLESPPEYGPATPKRARPSRK